MANVYTAGSDRRLISIAYHDIYFENGVHRRYRAPDNACVRLLDGLQM